MKQKNLFHKISALLLAVFMLITCVDFNFSEIYAVDLKTPLAISVNGKTPKTYTRFSEF